MLSLAAGEPKEMVLQGSGICLEKVLQNGKEKSVFSVETKYKLKPLLYMTLGNWTQYSCIHESPLYRNARNEDYFLD